jgi:ATP phosphoribosyltransferase regulatory subunit
LIGRFGRDLPSTGFAFDVDRLFQTMERVDGEPVRSDVHCLICSAPNRQAHAFEVARILRQGGFRVVLGHLAGTRPPALRLMLEEGKRLGVQMTVLVGAERVSSDKVVILAASLDSQQRTVTIKDLPNLLRH